jgi:5-methylcytosine-specific restriction endonuclease McrA
MSYQDYINLTTWNRIRSKRLKFDNWRCYYCGAPATEVHHLEYNFLGREKLGDLRSICKRCHKLWHEEFETLPCGYTDENFKKFLELKEKGWSFSQIKLYFIELYRKTRF